MMTTKSIKSAPVKRAPQRTCLACHKKKNKQELIRLVRVSDMSVEVDIEGRKAGRGAYLCRDKECWDKATKGTRLDHTLRTTLAVDNREQLVRFSEDLFGE